MIAAEPLLLDTPAPPGFRSIQQEAVADEGPRPLSMGAMAAPLMPISLRRDSIYSAFSTAMPVTDRHGLAGSTKRIKVRRGGKEIQANLDDPVQPEDVLIIREKLF